MNDISEDEIRAFSEQLDNGGVFISNADLNADVAGLILKLTSADSALGVMRAVREFAQSSPAQGYTAAVLDRVAMGWALDALHNLSPALIPMYMKRYQSFALAARRTGAIVNGYPQINPVEQGDPNRGATAADSE